MLTNVRSFCSVIRSLAATASRWNARARSAEWMMTFHWANKLTSKKRWYDRRKRKTIFWHHVHCVFFSLSTKTTSFFTSKFVIYSISSSSLFPYFSIWRGDGGMVCRSPKIQETLPQLISSGTLWIIQMYTIRFSTSEMRRNHLAFGCIFYQSSWHRSPVTNSIELFILKYSRYV